jgi:hypothetical protein
MIMAWETTSTEDYKGFNPGFPGKDMFGEIGGAVSDLFGSSAQKDKAKALRGEADSLRHAASLSDQNAKLSAQSTAIQKTQLDRQIYQGVGSVEANVASSGFADSGSALDVLRASAEQGALQHAVLGRQGLITEQGHKEQALSYRNMAGAADRAARSADKAGDLNKVMGGIKIAASAAKFIAGGF